jgi:hypothetical protein
MLDAQQTVDAAGEHHGGIPEDTTPTRGTVTHIAAVHCRYAPGSGSESRTIYYPVAGSGVLTNIDSADGWTADRGDERFVGYLVQLNPDSGRSGRSYPAPQRINIRVGHLPVGLTRGLPGPSKLTGIGFPPGY